jgi:hypothetical protein
VYHQFFFFFNKKFGSWKTGRQWRWVIWCCQQRCLLVNIYIYIYIYIYVVYVLFIFYSVFFFFLWILFFNLRCIPANSGGMQWCSWLRHCATSRKVAGSIHWHNPSGRTMALGSTQPLTEMSTRNISLGGGGGVGVKGGRCVGLKIIPPSCANCLQIWEPQPPGVLRACPGP